MDTATVAVRVLVVEDDPDAQALAREVLEHLGHAVEVAADLSTALDVLRTRTDVGLVCLDLGLPDVKEPLVAVRAVRSHDVPVVVLTARNDAELAVASIEAGAAAYLLKDRFSFDRLSAVIAANVADHRAPIRPAPTDRDVADVLELLRSTTAVPVWVASVGGAVFDPAGEPAPAASTVVAAGRAAAEMRGLGATVLDSTLGEGRPWATDLAGFDGIVVHRLGPLGQDVVVGLARGPIGSDDVAVSERLARLLGETIVREQARSDAVARADAAVTASHVDPLTGLLNRRSFDRVLVVEEARARRSDDDDAVIVIDLDELKLVNDRDGHAAGDKLLQATATALEMAVRATDHIFRLGGDEFVILAPLCAPDGGHGLGERVRRELDRGGVRASVGVAARRDHGDLAAAWHAADDAMLAEKSARR